ncbi:MAG: DUF2239 family protein [Gemmatimonadota bacterium]|jgi:hypothetical protein
MARLSSPSCIAFRGSRRIASGPLAEVAAVVKGTHDGGVEEPILVFEAETGVPVELDLRGTAADVAARYRSAAVEAPKRGPGRPRLGVVPREVTLLPRHWAWLSQQRGGASATLRRLVDEARRTAEGGDRVRRSQDATYRFMTAMAGDLPGYEEALRALYVGEEASFSDHMNGWPPDVRDHCLTLSEVVFSSAPQDRRG